MLQRHRLVGRIGARDATREERPALGVSGEVARHEAEAVGAVDLDDGLQLRGLVLWSFLAGA